MTASADAFDPAEADEIIAHASARIEALLNALAREADALAEGDETIAAFGRSRAEAWTDFADAIRELQEAPGLLQAADTELQVELGELMGELRGALSHNATLAGSAHAAGNRVLASCLHAIEANDEGANYDALGLLRRMVGRPVGYALHERC